MYHLAYSTAIWELVSPHLGSFPSIVAAVTYGNGADFSSPPESSLPLLLHLSGNPVGQLRNVNNVTVYSYPQANRDFFALPFQKDFHYASESISHTRNLSFLKRFMNGPYFDLEAIWNEHTYYEFGERSVEKTMATMVQEPYVNHVPTVCD
jgi:carboxymethylenebutenolidase